MWLSDRDSPDTAKTDWVYLLFFLLCLCGIIYVTISCDIFQPMQHAFRKRQWAGFFIRPSMLWALMGTVMLGFRTFLWFCYRSYIPAEFSDAPSLTVIIPAYNEGEMVGRSVASVLSAKYPPDRLEIIVVDDGSTDDTWTYIERASLPHPHLVTKIRFPKNRGKRAALAEGFLRARGEVVVTIDSDSVIDEETLLAIVAPFRNPRVGAVAGKVKVYNRRSGLIPRMLHVRFILSFDFLRSVQSTYGTVYCCPGALSAYRSSLIREVLPAWMSQTFLGVECTYGEDRSLTNFILQQGFDSVYQDSAVVWTVAPESYSKLCRMYLRWDRSYIREEFRLARILLGRPLVPRLIAMLDRIITNLRYPIGYATLALLVMFSIDDPVTILRILCVIGIMSMLNMLYYLRSERSWDFLFGIFYGYFSFFTLFWIFPFAALTLRSRSWMTR
jgi:hyaluronan synthase